MNLRDIITTNKTFILLWILWLCISAAWITIAGNSEVFLTINSLFLKELALLFTLITHLGDGLLWVIIIIGFLFIRYKWASLLTISFVLSTLVAQLLKQFVFQNELRPLSFFRERGIEILYSENITMHLYNSFPSGHTTTAFAMFFMLGHFFKRQGIFFVIALLIGFSRIYLAQHFPVDVLAGSFIGITCSMLTIYFFDLPFSNKMQQKSLLKRK
jgi:membrane-associated phospholipid phosphatase